MGVDYPYHKLTCHSLKVKYIGLFLFLFLVSFDTGKEVELVSKVAISNPYTVSYPQGWAY
jgi:hypothetical protein